MVGIDPCGYGNQEALQSAVYRLENQKPSGVIQCQCEGPTIRAHGMNIV